MNLALIAVTTDGIKVAERIKEKLNGEVTVFCLKNETIKTNSLIGKPLVLPVRLSKVLPSSI